MATRKPKNPELAQAADNLAEAAQHVGKAVSKKVDEIKSAASAELAKAKEAALKKGHMAQGKIESMLKKAEARLGKAARSAERSLDKAVRDAEKRIAAAKKAAKAKVAEAQKAVKPAPAKKAAAKKAPAKKAAAKKAPVKKAPVKKTATKPAAPKAAPKAPAKKSSKKAATRKTEESAPKAPLVVQKAAPKTPRVAPVVKKQVSTLEAGNKDRYSDKELGEFKEIILKKLDEARNDYELLKQTLANTDNNGTDDTSPSFKMIEDGSETMSREETAQLAARQEKFIKHLEDALLRIRNKTYGICRVTGKLISKERLRLVPHATLSIEAKQQMNG